MVTTLHNGVPIWKPSTNNYLHSCVSVEDLEQSDFFRQADKSHMYKLCKNHPYAHMLSHSLHMQQECCIRRDRNILWANYYKNCDMRLVYFQISVAQSKS